jgi:regulator of protease activity HflC (stomatin/prohibitin superfamily)
MFRSSIATTAVVSLLFTAACDKASDDQQKANAAQTEANGKIAAATTEATQKVSAAQAEADKKIAQAQANFMQLREDYRHSTTTSLVDLDKKVADLDTKANTATGKGKTDLDTNLKQIHAARDSFGADYRTLETSSATTWDATKARLDKEWTDLKALVDKA